MDQKALKSILRLCKTHKVSSFKQTEAGIELSFFENSHEPLKRRSRSKSKEEEISSGAPTTDELLLWSADPFASFNASPQ